MDAAAAVKMVLTSITVNVLVKMKINTRIADASIN